MCKGKLAKIGVNSGYQSPVHQCYFSHHSGPENNYGYAFNAGYGQQPNQLNDVSVSKYNHCNSYYESIKPGNHVGIWRLTGWGSHPPACPRFYSRPWLYVWFELVVGSHPCSNKFFSGHSRWHSPLLNALPSTEFVWACSELGN